MDAQNAPQVNGQATRFKPGISPNPGGKLRGAAHLKVVAELAAELGCEPTPSQALIIDEIARAKTNPRRKTPSATILRWLKQLGLPKVKPPKVSPSGRSLADLRSQVLP